MHVISLIRSDRFWCSYVGHDVNLGFAGRLRHSGAHARLHLLLRLYSNQIKFLT